MCSFNAVNGKRMDLDAHLDFSTHQSTVESINCIVNGNFLHVIRGKSNTVDKVSVCISTICALMKEFDHDWIDENMNVASPKDQKDYLAYFGSYLELPLRTLSDYLKRLRWAGRRQSVGPFQLKLTKYFDYFKATDPRVLSMVIAYLATALGAHNLWQQRQNVAKPIPWTLRVNRSGSRLTLRYQYWTKRRIGQVDKVVHSNADYLYSFKLSQTTADGIKLIQQMSTNHESQNFQRRNRKRS